jgi:hypothetical protein
MLYERMEYEAPIKEGVTTYVIPISTTKFLDVVFPIKMFGSFQTPSESLLSFKMYVADMASMYEEYSIKWFNKPTMAITFTQTVLHSWNYAGHKPNEKYQGYTFYIQQSWCPVRIIVQLHKITIEWKLIKASQNGHDLSGNLMEEASVQKSDEVPYAKNQIIIILHKTPRSEYHRKIRKARLVLAASKLRLDTLILRYTEKYGEFDNISDADSVLSSGLEDN